MLWCWNGSVFGFLKAGADFSEIVFIGAVPATMVILYVGVMSGDVRQEA